MFEKYHDEFNLEDNADGEFNVLAMFLLYEKCKGEKSFWHPYINSLGKSYTLFDWNKYDIKVAEDPLLQDEFKYYVDEMMDIWLKMNLIIKEYP